MLVESSNDFTLGFRTASGKKRNKSRSMCELIEDLIDNLASRISTMFPKVIWFFYDGLDFRLTANVEKNWKINDRF